MYLKKIFIHKIISPFVSAIETRRMLKFGNKGYKCLENIQRSPLTPEEKKQIQEKWGKCIPNPQIGYDQFEVYKYLHGFDVNFVPNAFYHPYIAKYLFYFPAGRVLSDKNMLWSFLYGIPQAETVIRKYDNTFFNADGSIIAIKKGVGIIKSCQSEMIIKPTIDSCGGKSIRLLNPQFSEAEIYDILDDYPSDFIIQQRVKQSPILSCLNNTSLNTIRINTLFLNGSITVTSMGLRIGKQGAIVDNASSDGVMAGICTDGNLKPNAFDLHGNKVDEVNKIKLSSIKIPNIDKVIELCIRSHRRMLQSRMIAWDIALREDNSPLVLEANVGYTYFYPGIRAIQLCDGPVFGDRTQEVIDYVAKMREIDKQRGRKIVFYSESRSKENVNGKYIKR